MLYMVYIYIYIYLSIYLYMHIRYYIFIHLYSKRPIDPFTIYPFTYCISPIYIYLPFYIHYLSILIYLPFTLPIYIYLPFYYFSRVAAPEGAPGAVPRLASYDRISLSLYIYIYTYIYDRTYVLRYIEYL